MNSRRSAILAWAGIGFVLAGVVAGMSLVALRQRPVYHHLEGSQLALVLAYWWALNGVGTCLLGAGVGAALWEVRAEFAARRRRTLAALFGVFMGLMVLLCVVTPLGGVIVDWLLRQGATVANAVYVGTGLTAALMAALLTSLADLTLVGLSGTHGHDDTHSISRGVDTSARAATPRRVHAALLPATVGSAAAPPAPSSGPPASTPDV